MQVPAPARSFWIWTALLLAITLLNQATAARHTRSSHPTPAIQAEKNAEFLAWLPQWWASEERLWSDLTSPKADTLKFYGQDREDKLAMEQYFHGKEDIFYLEMGAFNGVTVSNTLAFQQSKHSRGLLIEANPNMFTSLVQNRPHDICLNVAVCDTYQTVHWIHDGPPETNGIYEFMPEGFKKMWHPKAILDMPIPCMPLSAILKKVNVRHVDFWSLDVEGGELKILQTIDWKEFSADVIVIEADEHDPAKNKAVVDLLVQQGYTLDGTVTRNVWLHHSSFNPSRDPAIPLPFQ